MKYSDSIKPISYLKTHASEVIREISKKHKTMIITHNGEAKVVVQDIHVYEQTLDSLALLKILVQSSISVNKGDYRPIRASFIKIKNRIAEKNDS